MRKALTVIPVILVLAWVSEARAALIMPGTQIAPTTTNHSLTVGKAADESLASLFWDGVNMPIVNLPAADQITTALGVITKKATVPSPLLSGTLGVLDAATGKLSDLIIFQIKTGIFVGTSDVFFISDPVEGSGAETEIGGSSSTVIKPTFPFFGTATTTINIGSPAECAAGPARVAVCPPPEGTQFVSIEVVPEPGSLQLLAMGILSLFAYASYRKRAM